jgi:hypothetical protein
MIWLAGLVILAAENFLVWGILNRKGWAEFILIILCIISFLISVAYVFIFFR